MEVSYFNLTKSYLNFDIVSAQWSVMTAIEGHLTRVRE